MSRSNPCTRVPGDGPDLVVGELSALREECNQPEAHRLFIDPDIVVRGDPGIDKIRVPSGQSIDGATTSTLCDQVASLAERDELFRRLCIRKLKQLGSGPAVQGAASRQPPQHDEIVEAERFAAPTGLVDEADEVGVRPGGQYQPYVCLIRIVAWQILAQ